jgi:transposase
MHPLSIQLIRISSYLDTTSLYFEGAGGQTLGRDGYSKDHRPDLRQMILAVILDGDGQPVCSEMCPATQPM